MIVLSILCLAIGLLAGIPVLVRVGVVLLVVALILLLVGAVGVFPSYHYGWY